MKIYAKLLVIALMIAMIFAVGSVSAVENGTADASDLTLVPHEQVVSVPDSTVQEVETIDTETSADDTNVEKISSSSDEIINVTDSNVKESLKMSKKGDHQIKGYFDYVVPPLEGFWWQEGVDGVDYAHKEVYHNTKRYY